MIRKLITIAIVVALWLYEVFLKRLAMRSRFNPIPACVADVYDERAYRFMLSYHAEKNHAAILQSAEEFAVELLLLIFNVYASFAGLFARDPWSQMFAVILLHSLASLIRIPAQYSDTMIIEGRYGFNRTTIKTFILDRIKEFVLELGLMIVIGSLLIWLHRMFGDWLILVFTGVSTAFILLYSFVYPFFSRLFNKFKPLEDGELKEKLTTLLQKNGYRVRAINVMDASRRTTKANAYFAGFGKTKTIVLYDTLVEAMTPDEIVAVFAHELGHGLHKDTLKTQLFSYLTTLILGFFAWITLRSSELFTVFGFEGVNYGFTLILVISVEFGLYLPLLSLVMYEFTRRAEYRADAHAVKEGYGEALISALKKLARQNFSDLSPAPLLVALTYSHPTLAQRIEAIRKLERDA
jgi:STE24 endopeptidase